MRGRNPDVNATDAKMRGNTDTTERERSRMRRERRGGGLVAFELSNAPLLDGEDESTRCMKYWRARVRDVLLVPGGDASSTN